MLCAGDSWIASVRAETLSDMVPDAMMVDMNFRVEDEAWLFWYAAASSPRRVLA